MSLIKQVPYEAGFIWKNTIEWADVLGGAKAYKSQLMIVMPSLSDSDVQRFMNSGSTSIAMGDREFAILSSALRKSTRRTIALELFGEASDASSREFWCRTVLAVLTTEAYTTHGTYTIDKSISDKIQATEFAKSRSGRVQLSVLDPFTSEKMPETWRNFVAEQARQIDPADQEIVKYYVQSIKDHKDAKVIRDDKAITNSSRLKPGVYMKGMRRVGEYAPETGPVTRPS